MEIGRFLTSRVRAAVAASFAGDSRSRALDVLAAAPLKEDVTVAVAEQILLGLVKMSKGDLKRLSGSLEHFDPRDALYAFGGVDWDEESKDARL